MTIIENKKTFIPFKQTDGIYVLPVIFSKKQIFEIYKVSEIKGHHGDNGHGDEGHSTGDEEDDRIMTFKAEKPYQFPWAADLIYKNIPRINENESISTLVDQNIQIYTLPEGGGVVPVHVDKDFEVGNLKALYSILIYLNNQYTGGETVFNQEMYGPEVPVGAGVLFRHDIIHEGLMVISGEKHVLKTDLLFG